MKAITSVYRIITTRTLGATEHLGFRVRARGGNQVATIYYAHDVSDEENHRRALSKLMNGHGFQGWLDSDAVIVGGTLPNGKGTVWTRLDLDEVDRFGIQLAK